MSQFLIGGRGFDFKSKCPIFVCPKVPGEGGCQARMGQCLIFLVFFLKASLSRYQVTNGFTRIINNLNFFKVEVYMNNSQPFFSLICYLRCVLHSLFPSEFMSNQSEGISFVQPNEVCFEKIKHMTGASTHNKTDFEKDLNFN